MSTRPTRASASRHIIRAVNEDSGPFSSQQLNRREREVFDALTVLTEAGGDSYEAAQEIVDYFAAIFSVGEDE